MGSEQTLVLANHYGDYGTVEPGGGLTVQYESMDKGRKAVQGGTTRIGNRDKENKTYTALGELDG